MNKLISYSILLLVAINSVHYIRNQEKTRLLQVNGTFETRTLGFCDGVAENGVIKVTPEQISDQKTVMENLKTKRPGENAFSKLLLDTETIEDYAMGLGMQAAVWLVFAVLSMLGYFCYYICCYCDCCCPPCKCCRRQKPYTECQIRCTNYTLLVLSAVVIVVAIVAMSYNVKFADGQNSMRCAMLTILDSLLYGSNQGTYSWVGILPFSQKISALVLNVQSAATTIGTTFSGNDEDWLQANNANSIQTIISDVAAIYTNNQNMMVTGPQGGSVKPSFIDSTLGPITNQATLTGVLNLEFKTKGDIVTPILSGLKSNSQLINTQSATIVSALNSAQAPVDEFKNGLDSSYTSIKDSFESTKSGSTVLQSGLNGLLVVMMLGAALSATGILLAYFCKCTKLRCFMHLSWCLVCIIMIFSFIFTAVLTPISIVLLEFCEVFNEIISSSAGMNKYSSRIPDDVRGNLDFCMFQSGDMAEKFNIQSSLNQINDVTSSFNELDKYTNSSNPGYINMSASATTVTIWKEKLDEIISGQLPAASPATNDNNNQLVYKAYFNQQIDNCAASSDEWTIYTGSCTKSPVWSSGASTSSNRATGYGSDICIPIKDFSTADFSARYTGTCTNKATLVTIFGNLKAFDTDKTTKFTTLKNELTAIETKNGIYLNKFQAYLVKVAGLKTNINSLLDEVSNPQTGLVAGLNCKFLATNLKNLYNAFCVAMVVPLDSLITAISLASIGMFFLSFFAYSAGMRLASAEKHRVQDIELAKKTRH